MHNLYIKNNKYKILYLVNYHCFDIILNKHISKSFEYKPHYIIHYSEYANIRDACLKITRSKHIIDNIYNVIKYNISNFNFNSLYIVYRFVPDFLVNYLVKNNTLMLNIYLDTFEDYHIHFGALYYGIQSWLLRLHPDIINNTRIYKKLFRYNSQNQIKYNINKLYVLLSIIRLYLLYNLHNNQINKRIPGWLSSLIGDVVRDGVSDSLLDRVSVRHVRWFWYQLGGGSSSPRRFDPLARSNSVGDLLDIEYKIYVYYGNIGDPVYSRLFTLYLGYMIYLHQFYVVSRVYLGLEHFINVFRRISKLTTSSRRAVRLRGALFHSGLSFRNASVYHVKVSIDERDFKILRSLAARDKSVFDRVRVFTSFLKEPCSVRSRGRLLSGYQDPFRCSNLLDRITGHTDTLLRWLRSDATLPRLFAGLDVAGPEKASPNWPFSLPFTMLDNVVSVILGRRLTNSYHSGEDYISVFRGLRSIYDTIILIPRNPGDRIGHGYALGLHPMISGAGLQPMQELLEDLVWEYMLYSTGVLDDPGYRVRAHLESSIRSLSTKIYGTAYRPEAIWDGYKALYNIPSLAVAFTTSSGPLEPWQSILLHYYHTLTSITRRHGHPYRILAGPTYLPEDAMDYLGSYLSSAKAILRGSAPASIKDLLGPSPLKRAREIREYLIEEIARNKLLIEVCPSSNAAMHGLDHPAEHPLLNYLKREKRVEELVVIGTDDPGILNTDIVLDNYYTTTIK